jgi:hypothetical protein
MDAPRLTLRIGGVVRRALIRRKPAEEALRFGRQLARLASPLLNEERRSSGSCGVASCGSKLGPLESGGRRIVGVGAAKAMRLRRSGLPTAIAGGRSPISVAEGLEAHRGDGGRRVVLTLQQQDHA